MQATENIKRPVLRYYGGKYKIAPWVISHFPPHGIYVEPFGGAAGVLLRKPHAKIEVYNDLDERVVGVFRVLRDEHKAERLRRLCELTPFSRAEFDEALEPTDDDVEAARRVLVRSWLGFNGTGLRRSRTGFRAKDKSANGHAAGGWFSWPAEIPAFVERMKQVVLECRDALTVIADHDGPDTLFYVDPPYVHDTRGETGRNSYVHELTDTQHRKLLRLLSRVKGMVAVSGYSHPIYERMLRGWERHETTTIASGNGSQTAETVRRTEVLWLNAVASKARAAEAGMFA
jgi:DNA adenine methylase